MTSAETITTTENLPKDESKKYSPKEEFLNVFSHALGAMFAIYAIVMLAVHSSSPLEAAITAVYGAMLFILFQSSTCYHAMTNETAKKFFAKLTIVRFIF